MTAEENGAKTFKPEGLASAWIGIGAGIGMALGIIYGQLVWGMIAGAALGTVVFAVLAVRASARY